jgi:hypothetical protein
MSRDKTENGTYIHNRINPILRKQPRIGDLVRLTDNLDERIDDHRRDVVICGAPREPIGIGQNMTRNGTGSLEITQHQGNVGLKEFFGFERKRILRYLQGKLVSRY